MTVITTLQDPGGAYPASPDFSAYRGYCWFRDGAFIADGVSAVGGHDSASRFFDWCARVVERYEGVIVTATRAADRGEPLPDDEMLPARFTLDGGMGTADWWDFQLDGYGTWLWAAAEHVLRHGLDAGRWRGAAALCVDYVISSWQRPCYDWWEEHADQVHVSTLGCLAAGLRGAASAGLVDGHRAGRARATADHIVEFIEQKGVVDGHLVKWIGDDAVDGSLTALVGPLRVFDPGSELARRTVATVEEQLSTDGGVYRFRADTFYGGGRWPLLTCFLGLAKAVQDDRVGARRCLEWAASTATAEGYLPEQVGGRLLAPPYRQEWLDRWGPVATPLLWSHAMVLRLAAELGLADGLHLDDHREGDG